MASPIRLLFLALLLFVGYHAVSIEFGPQQVGFLDEFNYIPLACVGILTIIILLIDIFRFRKDRHLYQFSYSFIGVIILAIIFFKIIQREIIVKSETVLTITPMGGKNGWTFEFKKNNHFLLTKHNLFGQTIYHGKYDRINDSIIILNSDYDGNGILPATGVIKNDTIFWIKSDTMLVENKH